MNVNGLSGEAGGGGVCNSPRKLFINAPRVYARMCVSVFGLSDAGFVFKANIFAYSGRRWYEKLSDLTGKSPSDTPDEIFRRLLKGELLSRCTDVNSGILLMRFSLDVKKIMHSNIETLCNCN